VNARAAIISGIAITCALAIPMCLLILGFFVMIAHAGL
jgi:hypothetical protein